jgi:predicted nucleic acid-binding protein
VTEIKVVDASALGAVLFAEPNGQAVAAQLSGGRLVAPTLLGYEIANVCVSKIRANPGQRSGFLTAFANWSEMGIEFLDVNHASVLQVAEQFGLTSYDASYLWLAQRLGAELVTLDRRLGRATRGR